MITSIIQIQYNQLRRTIDEFINELVYTKIPIPIPISLEDERSQIIQYNTIRLCQRKSHILQFKLQKNDAHKCISTTMFGVAKRDVCDNFVCQGYDHVTVFFRNESEQNCIASGDAKNCTTSSTRTRMDVMNLQSCSDVIPAHLSTSVNQEIKC